MANDRSPATPAARRPGRPPKSDSAATRDRLLDVALELFARQGFAATTVRQIGAAAGISDTALYGHFPGKQALYDALFNQAGPVSSRTPALDPDEIAAAEPRAAIRALVEQAWAEWSSPRARQFLDVMLRDGVDATGPADLSAAIELTRDQLQLPFRRWQERGLVRTDLPPRQLVWELFAPLQVPRILYLRGDVTDADLATARQAVDDHVAFFLTSIMPAERTS